MSKGKQDTPDFIPTGAHEPQTGDVTDKYSSATDNGQNFTMSTDPTQQPLADPNAP